MSSLKDEPLTVTDCCGRLLPVSQTLKGDVHFPELCPACSWLDGREHESHITCTDGACPGRDWTYKDGQIIPASSPKEEN